MSDELYPTNKSTIENSNTSIIESSPTQTRDPIVLNLNVETVLTHVILFALCFTILYSILSIGYGYYYNIKYHDRESERLKDGYENGFLVALKIWLSNFVCILLAAIYYFLRSTAIAPIVGFIVIFCFLVKILYYDIQQIVVVKETAIKFWAETMKFISESIKKINEKPKLPDKK
jgi:small-conductance mechanosensitive channel